MEPSENRTDIALQDAVEAALRSVLGGQAPHIGVAADGGSVTLTGEVPTDNERSDAHSAAIGVTGVHAIADNIAVRDARSSCGTDSEIAKAAQLALTQADGIAPNTVVAEVRNHVVTLSGQVSSNRERLAAERAIIYLPSLTRINNRITVKT
jgi:osmotically-inducible protein OsmY